MSIFADDLHQSLQRAAKLTEEPSLRPWQSWRPWLVRESRPQRSCRALIACIENGGIAVGGRGDGRSVLSKRRSRCRLLSTLRRWPRRRTQCAQQTTAAAALAAAALPVPAATAAALAPAKVSKVEITDLASRSAKVTVPDYQLSLAIGKDGQNARLAARLTGWRIDIHPDTVESAPADSSL